MLRLALSLIAALAVASAAGARHAEEPTGTWKQVEDDEGIKVWRLEVPGRDLPGFRGEAVIPANVEGILAILNDVERHKEWMHRCSGSGILKRFDADHLIIYNRTDSPWPAWDRDVLLDTQLVRRPQSATISFHDTSAALLPLPERVVRMPRLKGFYHLRELSAEQTKVVYQIEADIGGSVPGWIAERLARDMPFETLRRLRKRVVAHAKGGDHG